SQLDLEDEITRLSKLALALAAGIRGLECDFDPEKQGLEVIALNIGHRLEAVSDAMGKARKRIAKAAAWVRPESGLRRQQHRVHDAYLAGSCVCTPRRLLPLARRKRVAGGVSTAAPIVIAYLFADQCVGVTPSLAPAPHSSGASFLSPVTLSGRGGSLPRSKIERSR